MIDNEKMRRIEKNLFASNPDAIAELTTLFEEIGGILSWVVDLSHRFIEGIGRGHEEEIKIIQRMLNELHMLKKKPS